MTTTTLRPNGTVTDKAAWVRTGGTTKHGVVADDSDATFITNSTETGLSSAIRFSLGTVAMPAGAVTKTARSRLRAKTAGGEAVFIEIRSGSTPVGFGSNSYSVSTSSFVTYSGTTFALNLTQAEVDDLDFLLYLGSSPISATDVGELYFDLTYALVPVANVTSPTGSPTITTTDRPTFTWTHTAGSDGGPQTFYEVKVFNDAQYGDGGFDPDTSDPYYTPGVVVGSASSQQSDPLISDIYRVYVRTAQTINGAAHWSVWDFEGFTMSVTPPTIEDVTTTADAANGRILVAVDRLAAGEAWNFLEVQRSIDAGVTWEYIRGGEYVDPTVTTPFSTGDASNFDIYDYGLANGQTAIYRARATRILVAPNTVTGLWVESTPAISWTSTSAWLKAPDDPTLNRTVKLSTVPELEFITPQGVFAVLGRSNPVVVSDVMSGVVGSTLTVQTVDETEMVALLNLLRTTRLLFQPPPAWNLDDRFIAVSQVSQVPVDRRLAINTYRRFTVSYTEIDPPADPLAGTP